MAWLGDKVPGLTLLGKADRETLSDPLWDNNPITLQVLGICSALAVTTNLGTALVMSAALVFVVCCSNMVVSAMREFIPSKVRIIVQLSVIASLVILVDQVLKAFAYEMSKQLTVFVGLIITNCIVMGRAEGFAMQNGVFRSFLDGLGNALGYSLVLCVVAIFREIFGAGAILGTPIVPESWYAENGGWYSNCVLMILPPGAFIVIGLLIWVQREIQGKVVE